VEAKKAKKGVAVEIKNKGDSGGLEFKYEEVMKLELMEGMIVLGFEGGNYSYHNLDTVEYFHVFKNKQRK
jgi:hypothetical protein